VPNPTADAAAVAHHGAGVELHRHVFQRQRAQHYGRSKTSVYCTGLISPFSYHFGNFFFLSFGFRMVLKLFFTPFFLDFSCPFAIRKRRK
jgi:hypothetical protein